MATFATNESRCREYHLVAEFALKKITQVTHSIVWVPFYFWQCLVFLFFCLFTSSQFCHRWPVFQSQAPAGLEIKLIAQLIWLSTCKYKRGGRANLPVFKCQASANLFLAGIGLSLLCLKSTITFIVADQPACNSSSFIGKTPQTSSFKFYQTWQPA